jgi:hypothetical protein
MNKENSATPKGVGDVEQIEIGSFFLETLTTGMYENPFHCIREYIQNSYDAIHDAISSGLLNEGEGQVSIGLSGTGKSLSLSIRDNGTGLPLASAYRTLVALGASRKSPTRHAGFRGIGRLAGIAYCSTLKFTTKARGESEGTILEFDCGLIRNHLKPGGEPQDVRRVILSAVFTEPFAARAEENYTTVEMAGLTGLGVEFASLEKLQPYLSQVCPVEYADKFDFADRIRALAAGYGDTIRVVSVETKQKRERVPVYKPYKNSAAVGGPKKRASVSTLFDIETFTSKELGWYGWIGKSNFPGEITDETVSGVRFRMKNIQIGSSRLIEEIAQELTDSGTERRLQRWAVGEIFITNTQIVPNARRDGFEDNQAWRDVRADIKEKVARRVVKLIRTASDSRSVLKRNAETFAKLLPKVRVTKITSADKASLEASIKGRIEELGSNKVAGADPKEVSSLVSKFKDLQELLSKVPVEDPPPSSPADTEAPSNGSASDENEAAGQAGAESEPLLEDEVLRTVSEVLVEEFGEEEAARVMDIIQRRLES